MPLAENNNFVGHEDKVQSVLDILFLKEKGCIALVRIGGVGKI